ncbi:MAG: molybdopterin molybdotransferase MoeA, partial [Spirochaetales bacterium]
TGRTHVLNGRGEPGGGTRHHRRTQAVGGDPDFQYPRRGAGLGRGRSPLRLRRQPHRLSRLNIGNDNRSWRTLVIYPDDAVRLMTSFCHAPDTETATLASALGRIIPSPVVSSMDQPPFDKAAMDGWAWQAGEGGPLPLEPLRARNVIAAGDSDERPLEPGETVKIMTGAPLPPGADRIQRVEWSEERDGRVTFSRSETVSNIIMRGENIRKGDELLCPRILKAQDLAILAADGRASIDVARRPIVGILSTGTELTEPGSSLAPGRIYDSNRTQILAQLAGGICAPTDLGSLPDDYAETKAAIRSALETCDVLVLSGGVSMGDFDYVPRALAACGVRKEFHGVAMKPGKPTFFGRTDRAFVFGLPGNPVSVFVNTELLVKPLLAALSGITIKPLAVPVRLAECICRKPANRVEFLPVRIDGDGAHPVRYGGSSALQALADADGFIRLEIDETDIKEGSTRNVRLVR